MSFIKSLWKSSFFALHSSKSYPLVPLNKVFLLHIYILCLRLGSLQSKPGHNDVGAHNWFMRWYQGTWGGGEGRKANKGASMSNLSVQAPGILPCWGPLRDCIRILSERPHWAVRRLGCSSTITPSPLGKGTWSWPTIVRPNTFLQLEKGLRQRTEKPERLLRSVGKGPWAGSGDNGQGTDSPC